MVGMERFPWIARSGATYPQRQSSDQVARPCPRSKAARGHAVPTPIAGPAPGPPLPFPGDPKGAGQRLPEPALFHVR